MREQPETFQRFGVAWTPVLVVFDPEGREQHRWEGYLPAEEFLGQLDLAAAKDAFAKERWGEAERRFRELADRLPRADFAPLALYYAGVARYKGGDASALEEAGRALRARYPDSSWARKSSVWIPADAAGSAGS